MCLRHRWYVFQRLLENSSLYLRWDLYIWRWNHRRISIWYWYSEFNSIWEFGKVYVRRHLWVDRFTNEKCWWEVIGCSNIENHLFKPYILFKGYNYLVCPKLNYPSFSIHYPSSQNFVFFLASTKMSRFCAIKLKMANCMCHYEWLVNCSN